MTSSLHMQEAQRQMVASALDLAKDYGVTLDYSEASIVDVNEVLMQLHNSFMQDARKESHTYALMGLAITFGAYIIEVIERAHSEGEWSVDTAQESERGAYPYTH